MLKFFVDNVLECLYQNTRLTRYLNSFGTQQDVTDDVVQNVAETLINKPVNPIEPQNYLKRSLKNAAIDHFRASQTRENYETQAAFFHSFEDTKSPERILEGMEGIAIIQQALSELPILSQQIFILAHVHGMTHRMIAEHFNLHLSTVEKRLLKARKHCLKRVSDYL
ncbi:MAG: RNA polymerase sigma factor [Pseudomonadota bacterium]